MSVENKVFRLRSCIAIVHLGQIVEFFDSNLRVGFSIEQSYPEIIGLLHRFDGSLTVSSISALYPEILIHELCALALFLQEKYVLIEVNEPYSQSDVDSRPRLINTLESYFHSTSEVKKAISQGSKASVLIIGLGAVGSWVLHCLIKAGVLNVTVMDVDVVESSNLHRQDLFFEADVGKPKATTARDSIRHSYGIEIKAICKKMESVEDLGSLPNTQNLIINCADFPSVDKTSRLVSDFCLKYKTPHIIGGGYNLHLTLIGQVVIPGLTACFHCFDQVLTPTNAADLFGVKKLNRKTRKIGSIGPVCGVSASITATEAIKVIFGAPLQFLAVVNKRVEFNLSNFDFGAFTVSRNTVCKYCSNDTI